MLRILPGLALGLLLAAAPSWASNKLYDMRALMAEPHPFANQAPSYPWQTQVAPVPVQPVPMPAPTYQAQPVYPAYQPEPVYQPAPVRMATPAPQAAAAPVNDRSIFHNMAKLPGKPLWGLISEARIGASLHNTGPFATKTESGIDADLELFFVSPDIFEFMWSPRPQIGMHINSEGETNQFWVGLA